MIHIPLCLLQHYLQCPNYESSPSVQWQMNKEMIDTQTMDYTSAIKKEWNFAFATWMDIEYYLKQGKSVTERQIPYDFTSM